MADGLVQDWDLFEQMWDYAMKQYIKVNTSECPVLISEKSYNTSVSRQRFGFPHFVIYVIYMVIAFML